MCQEKNEYIRENFALLQEATISIAGMPSHKLDRKERIRIWRTPNETMLAVIDIINRLIIGIVLLFLVFIKSISNHTIYKTHFVCLIILLVIYGVTSIHIERSTLDILEFILYVFFPVLFVSKIDIDVKLMIKAGVIAPFFSVFNLSSIFALREYTGNISMGTSYAFLFSIICAISYLFKYYREESKLKKIAMLPFLVIDFVIMTSVIMHGSRGPLLCI